MFDDTLRFAGGNAEILTNADKADSIEKITISLRLLHLIFCLSPFLLSRLKSCSMVIAMCSSIFFTNELHADPAIELSLSPAGRKNVFLSLTQCETYA